MSGNELTRRLFLRGSGSLAGSAALRATLPGLAALVQAACSARDAGADFVNLGADEARDIEAITARILPTTDTPGAREAGVIWFIDRAVGDFLAPGLPALRSGLDEFNAALAAAYPGNERFPDLDEADQDTFLATRDETPLFQLLRVATLMGMFCLPDYGGNHDYVGWKLLGLDPHAHAHTPPFGHYDAEYPREHADGD